jgi:glyceraldehyde 3-phosphate dehydrogenase
MTVRVAINGFGRVGRSVLRAAHEQGAAVEFVAVNDVADAPTIAHLLKFDSVFGPFRGDVEVTGDGIAIDGAVVRALAEADAAALP